MLHLRDRKSHYFGDHLDRNALGFDDCLCYAISILLLYILLFGIASTSNPCDPKMVIFLIAAAHYNGAYIPISREINVCQHPPK
jgi:hypothetical protein